jgi:hypothetical protein
MMLRLAAVLTACAASLWAKPAEVFIDLNGRPDQKHAEFKGGVEELQRLEEHLEETERLCKKVPADESDKPGYKRKCHEILPGIRSAVSKARYDLWQRGVLEAEKIEGSAEICQGKAMVCRPLREGDPIFMGATVRVTGKGKVNLRYPDGSYIQLKEGDTLGFGKVTKAQEFKQWLDSLFKRRIFPKTGVAERG